MQYFVNVHPQLAKLLITLAALIFGYDDQFDFKDIQSECHLRLTALNQLISVDHNNIPYVDM